MTWEPLPVTEVARLFAGFEAPWWIAGGYAIELALGRPIREHDDIDVLLLRRDHVAVQEVLAGWELWAADPPGSLRPWLPGESLPFGIHDIWCRRGNGPWQLQLMIDESSTTDWISRRDPRLRRPLPTLGALDTRGIPYLAPEVQLFYKSQAPRPKDWTDFTAALPILTEAQRHWLTAALPADHPWKPHLT
ncbi:nucleotidyltransferase domain-containing protein [Actinokineospora globicatena]|uniref:nucleotidyltransferase domain-containing protein n=1 Tax=Actinokineospora globicatena TaxID=103729 RepID=UPI0020A26891|nr:amino acid transporter [Actinokineospora globicatena]MCP2301986.1 Aminoglycoside-2''-adenylyltransferase [Actinokineospora globicatena]